MPYATLTQSRRGPTREPVTPALPSVSLPVPRYVGAAGDLRLVGWIAHDEAKPVRVAGNLPATAAKVDGTSDAGRS